MPVDFNKYPYFDDFNEDNLYYRLLFQPGRAVQARELTQIQTILQKQVEHLGSHIFKDGARVYGGAINYDKTTTRWLAVKAQDIHGKPVAIRDITPGLKIRKTTQADSGGTNALVRGTITKAIPAEFEDPDTIYFQWDYGEDIGFLPDEVLIITDPVSGQMRYTVTTLDVDSQKRELHYGTPSSISVGAGIYFWKGMFVKFSGGSISLSKYSKITTYIVGLGVSESVSRTDPRSLDPASHTSNHGAPGADRYRIELNLTKIGNGITFSETLVPNFIEIARIDTGNFYESASGLERDVYSILGDRLAERTFEESGNYVARPYNIAVKNKTTTDNPKLSVKLSEGLSYVKGYRHSLNHQESIEIDKGRDVVTEDENIDNIYGDNFVFVYDEANTSITHPENANGIFSIGSGSGEFPAVDAYGQRGAAVSLHCVPQHLVKNHSLASENAWNSTLVGTARPIQMAYDTDASDASHNAGRAGDVYSLWLGDFKSSPISSTVGSTNIIKNVSAYANSEFTIYHFTSESHGITANDRISVTGATDSVWNVDYQANIAVTNSTAVVVGDIGLNGVTSPSAGSLTLYRTTGNTNPRRTVVLNESLSAAWNDSYVGATVSVASSVPRKIIGYVGTDSSAETKYNERFGWSKRGMAILDRDLDSIPETSDTYELNMTSKQARSVVYNQNISATTGAGEYPAILDQSWNIDPISGVTGGNTEKLSDDVYGGRIDGDCLYNRHGKSVDGEDALLFSTGKTATRSFLTYGNLDDPTGYSSNTTLYYTEICDDITGSGGAATDFFTASGGARYKFFDRPVPYPYDEITITNKPEIKRNYILANRTTGAIETEDITSVQWTAGSTNRLTVTKSPNFGGGKYALLFPVKAQYAKPAYKKRITGNTTHTSERRADGDLTNFSRGQIIIQDGTYGTTAGSRISLMKPDGFKLNRVVKNIENADANTKLALTSNDVTSSFDFDSGQRDMFYDNCSIILKPDAIVPTGNLFVSFDHFQRMDKPKGSVPVENITSPSYFSVDSYQYTTDIIFSSMVSSLNVGDRLVSNSGVIGYVLDFANTAGNYSKVRLIDVSGPPGSNGEFVLDEFLLGGGGSKGGKIKEIIEADLSYSEIPTYTSRGKRAYPLRNMIDARAYVSTNNRVSDTISDSMMSPIPTRSGIKAGRTTFGTPMSTPVKLDHFVGRIDKITIDDEGNFDNIKGTHAIYPVPPRDEDSDKKLTLFSLRVPPYTFDPLNVDIQINPAMRHTMKDIGRLAKRVENLEYYVSLNALEKAASDLDITFADGTERFKNGILVDNFTGSGVADRDELRAAIGSGVLRPQSETMDMSVGVDLTDDGIADKSVSGAVPFRYDSSGSSDVEAVGIRNIEPEVIMLNYGTKPLITQPVATSAESVNPFDLQNFTGTLKLTPDYDRWMDVTKVPEYNSLFHGTLDSITGVDENSSATEIANAIKNIDRFWSDIAGRFSLGDDIEGESFHTEEFDVPVTELARSIELGSARDQYFNTGEIDAAIAQHGLTDGMTRNLNILPYIRPRDIVIQGSGLKPNHLNTLMFEDTGVERWFSRATEIYMERTTAQKFQPQLTGEYEKIKLTGVGPSTANAILIAVRDPFYKSSITTEKVKVGYIVPVFKEETGKVDWATYKDGFYDAAWADFNDILIYGFQGSTTDRTITGQTTGAMALLKSAGVADYHNGHYTGTARNSTANTTHIHLSPDAHRYVSDNFRKADILDGTGANEPRYTGVPFGSVIRIVAGTGAGQECMANSLLSYTESGSPIIELFTDRATGSTGLRTGIDSTSVYSIGMKSVDPDIHQYGVTQIGSPGGSSNHYGDKIGVLHLPSSRRTGWTAGKKLVEIFDRYSKDEWLVSSYASAYYFAQGMEREEVETSGSTLELLHEIRSKLNAFRIQDHPEQLGYVPATNLLTNEGGKLAVVTGINIANGRWTATSTDNIPWVQGGGPFGEVNFVDQAALSALLSGAWAELEELYPDIYAKYYSQYGT